MAYKPFRRQDFSPSCPSGGTWWACGYGTYFVGCCARDPCDVTCAQGNLYPGAFDPKYYGLFPDATCGTGSEFYTCTANKTFWGCCQTNACSQGGCPSGELEPAILNRADQLSAYDATGGTTMTSVTMTSIASATAASTTTANVLPPTASPSSGPKSHVGAIAGGAAGGALALAVVVALIVYYCCHARASRKEHESTVVRQLSDHPGTMAEKSEGAQAFDAPPGYASPPVFYPQDTSYYHAYAHHQQSTPEPQEMPIEPLSPVPFATKPFRHGHQRGASELSGDTATRSELGTPLPSPNQQTHFVHQNPPSPQPQFGQQEPGSVPSNEARQDWAPLQNRQIQPDPSQQYSPGLGVQGLYEGNEMERVGEQTTRYHGV